MNFNEESKVRPECKVRPEIINFNRNYTSFYPYSVKISKCSGICSNINDPYAKCVFLMLLNISLKVFNLNVKDKWNKIYKTAWNL